MSSKRNINKPKKVSTLLPSIFKKLNKKNNNELLEIKVNWKKIIGDDLCEKCYVSTLKRVNNRNVLTIISESSEGSDGIFITLVSIAVIYSCVFPL